MSLDAVLTLQKNFARNSSLCHVICHFHLSFHPSSRAITFFNDLSKVLFQINSCSKNDHLKQKFLEWERPRNGSLEIHKGEKAWVSESEIANLLLSVRSSLSKDEVNMVSWGKPRRPGNPFWGNIENCYYFNLT